MYFQPEDSKVTLSVNSWDDAFSYVSGNGITVNGTMINMENSVKSPNGDFYVGLGQTVSEGAILKIGGVFCCEAQEVDYAIEDCSFQWNGSAWVDYIEYKPFNVGKLAFKSGDDSSVYFKPADSGVTLPIDSWEAPFSYVSGNGITVNGTMISMENSVKSPSGDFYVALGQTVNTGAILKIGGVLRCEAFETDYVIEDCSFKWNGSAWEEYIEYTEYNISNLTVHVHSTAERPDVANASSLWLFVTGGATVSDWPWFVYESGAGFKVNGEAATLTGDMANAIQDFGGGLYFTFAAVEAGDVVSIGGVFSNADLGIRYTIPESKFQWNGSGWVAYVPPVKYTEYTLSNLQVANTSMAGGAYCANNVLSLSMVGGATVNDWPWFVYESGAGFKVNGEAAALTGGIANAIQDTNGGLYFTFAAVEAGDVVSIGGVFSNADLGIRYTIPESKFQWNGSSWVAYVEYEVHNLGVLELHVNSSVGGASGLNNVLYLQRAGGTAFPVLDWDHVFTYESGDGWKVNGGDATLTTMKSTPDGLYLDFEAVPTNAVVSISGTFVYSQAAVKYVIDESKFVWNGSGWEKYVKYTEYNVGTLTVNPNSIPGAASAVNTSLYLLKENGSTVDDWTYYTYVSGAGFKVNGETATLNAIQNVGSGLYLAFEGVSAGDVISIEGTYKCVSTALKYVIPESQFVWTGSGWNKCNYYTDSQLAAYDVVTLVDLGLGIEKAVEGEYDGSQNTYTASAENTTGSVKFRFQVNSVDTENGVTAIRLRGSEWSGVRFEITEGVIRTWNETANSQRLPLSNNTDYVIELGAIDVLNSDYIWVYIKIDGLFMASEMLLKTEISDTETDGAAYGTYNTNAVSLYVSTTNITLTDPDHVSVTYTASCGSSVEYVEKNSNYTVSSVVAKTYNTFIGWVYNDALYTADDTLQLAGENITLTALEIDFRLEEGAAIRVGATAETSGIRFTTLLKETDLNTLKGYIGEGSVSYGTLILPYDYLDAGEGPNLEEFTPGVDIIKISSTYAETNNDGDIVYRGAMQKLYEENYGRLFAGRGYMEITLEGGKTIRVYTPFDKKDNVRSIRQIAQAFQVDTTEPAEGEIRYETLSETRKEIVDAYAALNEIELMDYAAYAANNFFNVIAWNYPALDESNNYNNEKNEKIVKDMKATGIRVVNLTGKNLLVMNTQEAIEKTRQIINFFWSQGLKTVAFAANNVENFNTDFTQIGTPDFSDCEGFIGFIHWDEPTEDDTTMSKLADLAIQFNNVYAGSDVTYMNNLLPSYAPYFQKTETSWFGGSSTTLDKDAYKDYVKEYCDKVLSQVKGEKWLSVDSYPINKDYSLHDTFLFDLGVIKYYAMTYGAHAHVALQSSGFGTDDNDTKARIPTEAEMRMQAYAALAFGMDSISWFTYSPSGSDSETFYTFVDNDGNITNQTAYDAFTTVNMELAEVGKVYSAFEWKGIILGKGTNNEINTIFSKVEDKDYDAFETVSGQIGDYQLSTNDTKYLSSVATNKTDWNYLMGVMQDANGNEGYVLCNYNSRTNENDDRAQKITLTFNKNITQVIIYRGGKADPKDVSNNTVEIDLATGEGVIVLPSKLG
ncbi:MAG: hypothetical protein J6K86_05205 [Clostridia bacterium]|nr:hypothetical protein [Clostridia bacterium]